MRWSWFEIRKNELKWRRKIEWRRRKGININKLKIRFGVFFFSFRSDVWRSMFLVPLYRSIEQEVRLPIEVNVCAQRIQSNLWFSFMVRTWFNLSKNIGFFFLVSLHIITRWCSKSVQRMKSINCRFDTFFSSSVPICVQMWIDRTNGCRLRSNMHKLNKSNSVVSSRN